MTDMNHVCNEFASILKGKGKLNNGVCSVDFNRNIPVYVQGKRSTTVVPAGILFESLDESGNALNIGEIAVLQEEIPRFMYALVQQGIIVSALHNHWIYMDPLIMYIHIQSVEPPLQFAQKVAYAFTTLNSYPVAQE